MSESTHVQPYQPPTPPSIEQPTRKLRLWPGVVIVALMWAAILALKALGYEQVQDYLEAHDIETDQMLQFMGIMWAPMIATALVLVWWLFASRLRWWDRVLIPFVFAVGAAGMVVLSHDTIGGFGLIFNGLPVALTAWVGWLVISQFLSWPIQRPGLILAITLAFAYHLLVRNAGVTGQFVSDIQWRWTETKEDEYLASLQGKKQAAPVEKNEALKVQPGDWAAFRGDERDSRVTGTHVATTWDKQAPKLIWRKQVGPGWGSFTVVGGRLFTQEQRGPKEVVVCWHADTGDEIWAHEDDTRFTETVAGPGPRATPTFHEGKVYTQGANGRLNCLDAATGRVLWFRDVAADTGAKVPMWGFSSSPLIAYGLVSVYAGGPDGKSVVAYDAATGKPAWFGGDGTHSYSSMQLAKLQSVDQILSESDAGLTSLEPVTGKTLWKLDWKFKGARCCQPAVLNDSEVLVGTPFSEGIKRIKLTPGAKGWDVKEVWFSKAISPYYNDLVVHKGSIYGFDGSYFTCVDLKSGKRQWRERGYENGQVLLLADQDLLLIATEQGEIALVTATPDSHRELARIPAITGKTWNHPVVAHGRLYVRNGAEAACFELPQTPEVAEKTQ